MYAFDSDTAVKSEHGIMYGDEVLTLFRQLKII